MDDDFGHIDIDESVLVSILRNTPKVSSVVEAQSLLNQAYEQTFGIFDYINQTKIDDNTNDPNLKRPLAEVAYHPSEDTCVRSELYRIINEFKDRKINQYFGISLVDFLELPVDVCDYIIDISGKQLNSDSSKQNDIIKDLNDGMGL